MICGDENVNAASVGFFDSKISTRNEEKLIAVSVSCISYFPCVF